MTKKTYILHDEDCTVSYWSVVQNRWLSHQVYIPCDEYLALPKDEREAMGAHLERCDPGHEEPI